MVSRHNKHISKLCSTLKYENMISIIGWGGEADIGYLECRELGWVGIGCKPIQGCSGKALLGRGQLSRDVKEELQGAVFLAEGPGKGPR